MNIEQFYDENPVRRDSEEIEFGLDWSDEAGNLYELAWIAETGELYAMTETDATTVHLLAVIPTRPRVERVLAGWSRAMDQPDSLAWVRDRVTGRTQPGRSDVGPEN